MSLQFIAPASPATDVAACTPPTGYLPPTSHAIISINVFNVYRPPVPLRFGEFKACILNKPYMHKLAKRFRKVSFDPFNWDSMIPILLSTRDIRPGCINTNLWLGYRAPELILTQAGMERQSIIACGGYHRHCAIIRTLRHFNRKINEASDNLEHLERMLALDRFGFGTTNDAAMLWGRVQTLEFDMMDFKKWGVVVYDIGSVAFTILYYIHLIYRNISRYCFSRHAGSLPCRCRDPCLVDGIGGRGGRGGRG